MASERPPSPPASRGRGSSSSRRGSRNGTGAPSAVTRGMAASGRPRPRELSAPRAGLSGEGPRTESGRWQPARRLRAAAGHGSGAEPQRGVPVRVRAPGKPLLGATCSAAEAAAAAAVALVGAVAAPPLSTRAGPHNPRQGPRAANHSGARGEAPPLPGTSATSEEGE